MTWYGHKLSEEEYPLLLISDSPSDFLATLADKLTYKIVDSKEKDGLN